MKIQSNPNLRKQFHGFTLTELLVVILIIVVIAALSMTLITRIRNMADKASAVRSLSQLQIANAGYAADHSGRYVPFVVNDENGNRSGWWYQVPEFLNYFRGEVLRADGTPSKSVPLSMLDPKVVRKKLPFYNSMAGNFGLNNNGLPSVGGVAGATPSHTTFNITQPELSMAFASATDVRLAYNSRFKWNGTEGKTSNGAIAYRHGDKAIVVYFDGHVGEMGKSDMKTIDEARGGSKSAFWRPNRN